MIKGAQKRMIVMKTADSEVFEEVYFVMRREPRGEKINMLSEANRIIESCGGGRAKKKSGAYKRALFSLCLFLCGGLFGGALTILIYAIV